MAADNLLKNWSITVDGIGKAGNCGAYKAPDLKLKVLDFQAGDMDAPIPIDDGMEALEASYSIYGMDEQSYRLFGFMRGREVSVKARCAFENMQGQVKSCVDELRGLIISVEPDEKATGSQKEKMQKVTMRLSYFKSTYDNTVLVEIDPVNHVRKLGGVDTLAEIRRAMSV